MVGRRCTCGGNMPGVLPAGQVFFPLDAELGLLPGQYTPQLYESLVRLSAWMPFAAAAETLAALLGVPASAASAVRAAEAAGAAYVALQDAQVAELEREAPPAPVGPTQVAVSADGAMVPLLHGQWNEVRTLVIGEVQATAKGEVHTQDHSYFSRLASAEAFTRLALVETHARGLEHSAQVAALMDGADWLQGLVDHHCPRAVRILDFAHAGQRIGEIGQALFGATPQAQVWTEQWLHSLKHEGPEPLLAELRTQQAHHPTLELLAKHLAYLEKRQAHMRYPAFSQQGWPIGSGMVESANKNVVEARLKGTGMHWHPAHVNPMLALRNILCSDRWATAWPQIETHLRTQAAQRRRHRCHRRRQAKEDRLFADAIARQLAAAPPPPPPTPHQDPLPEATDAVKGKHRPAANHPWRHAPIGRARFQHRQPKN
jgi:hypothetical protein